VPLYRGGGDRQGLGRLLDGEAAEEAQLDDPGLIRIELGEPLERLPSARTSNDWPPPATRASSKVTRGCAPPRFCAPRARARSIRICRMECAAIAQKCARFCQRSGRSFINRR
jgi:hypothetical protein